MSPTEHTPSRIPDARRKTVGKPKTDQLLADVNKVIAQAMKAMAEANKLAQTKFEPEQVRKDLIATQALLEQLKVLTAAASDLKFLNTEVLKAHS